MEIPSYVEKIIGQFWQPIVKIVGKQLKKYYFEQVGAKHWLVEFDKFFDTSHLEQECADYHQGSGQGSWTIHSIRCLVRGLLAKYLFNASYRETEEMVKYNLLVKLWVGYGLFEGVFDHTTLQRFETWVLVNHNLLFFDEIVRQIDKQHQTKHRDLQVIDSFGMLGRAIEQNVIVLVRQVAQYLLKALEKDLPNIKRAMEAEINREALFGAENEKASSLLKKAERIERLQTVGEQIIHLQAMVATLEPALLVAHPNVEQWQSCLTKIIADHLKIRTTQTQAEVSLTITELSNKKEDNEQKGSYCILSANDLDMTLRVHGKGKVMVGYNASVVSDETYVRYTQVDTGAQPDQTALPDVFKHYQEHKHPLPKKMSGDMAYGNGKTRALVAGITEGQTTIVAKCPNYDQRTDRFTPSDFILDESDPRHPTLTCPNKVTTTTVSRDKNGDGFDFRFSPKMCRACPLFIKCRGEKGNPNGRRTVYISYYLPFLKQAKAYNQTEQGQSELKQRSVIERHIFNLTNLFGARRAKSYGLVKANFQLRMAAMAFNIRQFLRYGTGKQKPQPQPATG